MSVEYEIAIQSIPYLNFTFNIQQCCSKAISVNIRNTHLNSALLYTRKKKDYWIKYTSGIYMVCYINENGDIS